MKFGDKAMNKNKRIKITLDPIQEELLNSLCLRYHSTKSDVIVKALMTLASKRKHNVTILFREPKEGEDGKEPIAVVNQEMTDEEVEKLMEEIKNR